MNEKNTSELLAAETETKFTHQIKFHEQIIHTQRAPNPKCKHCKGVGYAGTYREKPLGKMPIGRNDKCPCGSDKKFKKCCLDMVNRMRYSGASILTCGCAGKAKLGDNPELETLKAKMAELQSKVK